MTALLPVAHGDSTRQILGTGLVSMLVTPLRFAYPLYAQVEVDETTYLDGTAGALPPGAAGVFLQYPAPAKVSSKEHFGAPPESTSE